MIRPTAKVLAPLALAAALSAAWAQPEPRPAFPPQASPPQAMPAQAGAPAGPLRPAAGPDAGEPAATSSTGARRSRSYARCNRSARRLGLRGPERHRYIARCRLGYEAPVVKP